jgi:Holliday junction resolvase
MSYGNFGRGGQRRWEKLSEVDAMEHIAAFEEAHAATGEALYSYCQRTGVHRNALAEAINFYIPDRAATLIQKPADAGKRGVKFESALKGLMRTRGYYSMRQYGSKSPFDLLCVGLGKPNLMIQAKKDGKLYYNEWNALWEIATANGCLPILAVKPPDGAKGALWFKLAGPKEKKGQRNDGMLIPFDPKHPDQDSLLAPQAATAA